MSWGVYRTFGLKYPSTVWNVATGAGVSVAVVDSGIYSIHPDLHGKVVGGVSFFEPHDPWGNDTHGHGTHVAGIVHQVAPNADLYDVKVIGMDGSTDFALIGQGIEWASLQGIKVVNLSLGGSSGDGYQVLKDICDAAEARGTLLIAAAGNNESAMVNYPAGYSSVMAISSCDIYLQKSWFTSYGSHIEMIAPGSDIPSTFPPYLDEWGDEQNWKTMNGTSMSCPHVVGAAALLWQLAPAYTNAQIRQTLKNTAQDLGLISDYQGSGMVRADSAMATVFWEHVQNDVAACSLAEAVADRDIATNDQQMVYAYKAISLSAENVLTAEDMMTVSLTEFAEKTEIVDNADISTADELTISLTEVASQVTDITTGDESSVYLLKSVEISHINNNIADVTVTATVASITGTTSRTAQSTKQVTGTVPLITGASTRTASASRNIAGYSAPISGSVYTGTATIRDVTVTATMEPIAGNAQRSAVVGRRVYGYSDAVRGRAVRGATGSRGVVGYARAVNGYVIIGDAVMVDYIMKFTTLPEVIGLKLNNTLPPLLKIKGGG